MNPDLYSAEYQAVQAARQREEALLGARRAQLHRAAVARRRKAKRGGKR